MFWVRKRMYVLLTNRQHSPNFVLIKRPTNIRDLGTIMHAAAHHLVHEQLS